MKELLQFLLGIVLTIIGVIIFLQNVVVSSFTLFYRMGQRECRRYSDCAHRCGIYRIYCEAEHADRTITDRIVRGILCMSGYLFECIDALYERTRTGIDPRHNRRRCRIHHQGPARREQGRERK